MKGPMSLTADLIARCERQEPDPGPDPRVRYFTAAEYEVAADGLIEQAPPGQLWIFAYGSLMWKPAIATTDHRHAVAHGWHRSFCLRLTRGRGSAAQPGLMMGLRRGGRCKGMLHRIPDDDRRSLLVQLLRREIGTDKHLTGVRWINVDAGQGRARALTFWAEPIGLENWVDLPLPEVAHILARACGHIGSGAAYLFHTVSKLDELGIRDRNLWRLQQLVANEIRGMHQASLGAPESFSR